MFAGPNGSGKSTLKPILSPELLGIYINPDDIEKEIRQHGGLDLASYGVQATQDEVLNFFANSTLLEKAGLLDEAQGLRFSDGEIIFHDVAVNAYFASVAADFIRQKLLDSRISFTFETVMSSPDKIELLRKAQSMGYRTYLYYIAIEDPVINISRVRRRVRTGGHSVPEDKIVSRYRRSLKLLIEAVRCTNRAYIFDNSGEKQAWIVEITEGKELEKKTEHIPRWVNKWILEKIGNSE
jgi:predicted ABC-type ATPase